MLQLSWLTLWWVRCFGCLPSDKEVAQAHLGASRIFAYALGFKRNQTFHPVFGVPASTRMTQIGCLSKSFKEKSGPQEWFAVLWLVPQYQNPSPSCRGPLQPPILGVWFSGGYPGYLVWWFERETKGKPLFFQGSLKEKDEPAPVWGVFSPQLQGPVISMPCKRLASPART